MTRRDWLLLYLALKGAPGGLDPVKIQKGMFLFAMEGDRPAEERYIFTPYLYGPMSSEIYRDVERLEADGLVYGERVPGYTWRRYSATPAGLDSARALLESANAEAARRLHDIKQRVAQQTFTTLLRDVYARYPRYAERSIFSG